MDTSWDDGDGCNALPELSSYQGALLHPLVDDRQTLPVLWKLSWEVAAIMKLDAITTRANRGDHVVSRLRWRIQDATQMGFHVRSEPLDGRPADWCQIGSRRMIFLDLSVPAAEQLAQLDDVLADYKNASPRATQPAGNTAKAA